REIVGVVVHVVSVTGLAGTSVASAVMRDDPIAVIQEKHHLRVPVVGAQWPAVAENDWLACSPVLVINLCTVLRGERTHCCGCLLTALLREAIRVPVTLVKFGRLRRPRTTLIRSCSCCHPKRGRRPRGAISSGVPDRASGVVEAASASKALICSSVMPSSLL